MIERIDWFYLFASVEFCCRGVESTYYTIVGRSESPTGPFKDMKGTSIDPTGRWVGPGHIAILSVDDGDFVAYHAYDRQAGGRPTLRIQRIGWGNDAGLWHSRPRVQTTLRASPLPGCGGRARFHRLRERSGTRSRPAHGVVDRYPRKVS